MPVSVERRSSYSARSASTSTQSGGMNLVRRRVSSGAMQGYAPSVYGGAGGYGTRISQSTSVFSSGSMSDSSMITNEKVTMQNLNDRLASYLEKVRSLESANRKLEQQIKDFYEKKCVISRDFSGHYATISDLRAQISRRHSENQGIILQIENAQLAMEDFKLKFEMESQMRMSVEADISRLRGVRDSMNLAIADLKTQIEGLKEELAYIKASHAEEMKLLRVQQTGAVNVQVDSAQSTDLTIVLEDIRRQYEELMTKNKTEVERWFQNKMEGLQTQITTCTTEVKTSSTELSDLKKTYQNLEIKLESHHAETQCLHQSLEETKTRYNVQLSQLQVTINMLEEELQKLRESLEHQRTEYNLLLDIKMRLELEIAEYRRLLDGEYKQEYKQTKAVVISKVVERVEEKKPHIERRVKTIVEEIIDGKVVSSVVDTQVEDVQ